MIGFTFISVRFKEYRYPLKPNHATAPGILGCRPLRYKPFRFEVWQFWYYQPPLCFPAQSVQLRSLYSSLVENFILLRREKENEIITNLGTNT